MAEKGKKDKNIPNGEEPKEEVASDTLPVVEQPASTTGDLAPAAAATAPTTALVAPADVEDPEDYALILATAKNKLQTVLEELQGRLVRPEEQQDIARLIAQATPNTQGVEEMDERWSIPVVRVVQGMTREKPDNARVGDLYTTAGDVLKGGAELTPLYIYETNRMFPQDNKGPVCFAPDAKLGSLFGYCRQCPNQPLGKNATGQATDCDNGICAIVLSADMKLYRMEFYRTSKKAGRQLFTYAKQSPAIWHKWFNLSTVQQKNDKGEFFVLKIVATGKETPAHIREASAALYTMISTERKAYIKTHYDQALSGGVKATKVDESTDFLPGKKKEEGTGGTNPDLSDAGI